MLSPKSGAPEKVLRFLGRIIVSPYSAKNTP